MKARKEVAKPKAKAKAKTVAKAKAKPIAKAKARPIAKAKAKPIAKAKPVKRAPPAKTVTLLAGGNPQIAKGDGDAPVAEYIAALDGWKHDLVSRIDALIGNAVPGVRRAIKWNSPFYGAPARDDFFLGLHVMTKYAKLAFFRGQQLEPIPPGESKGQDTRYLDLYEADELDEKLLTAWIVQASRITGWSPKG